MADPTTQLARISLAASDLDGVLDKLFANTADLRAILERIGTQTKKADGDD
jgi:hypothetical protein